MATSACVGAARLLEHRQRALQQRLGRRVVAHLLIELREVVHRLRGFWRVGTERPLTNRQRSGHQRLCGPVVALAVVQDRQGIEVLSDIRVIAAHGLLADRDGPFKRAHRPGRLSRAAFGVREDPQGVGHIRVVSSVRALGVGDQLLGQRDGVLESSLGQQRLDLLLERGRRCRRGRRRRLSWRRSGRWRLRGALPRRQSRQTGERNHAPRDDT